MVNFFIDNKIDLSILIFILLVVTNETILQQRNMEGHTEMGLIGENFDAGLMGRMRDDEDESRSESDNFEGASGDDQDAGDDQQPKRKKRYHRHTPHQIQELES